MAGAVKKRIKSILALLSFFIIIFILIFILTHKYKDQITYISKMSHLHYQSYLIENRINNGIKSIHQNKPSSLIKTIKTNINEHYLIAHAGGGINGIKYSNSIEAIKESIQEGYMYIEIDMLESSDGKIIAAHSWHELKKQLKYSDLNNKPLAQKDIVLDHAELKPVKMSDLNHFVNNETFILITDKINNYTLLAAEFDSIGNIIVEVFSTDDYNKAKELGINNLALSIDINQPKIVQFLLFNGIDMVTFRGDTLRSDPIALANAKLINKNNILSLIFSRNDLNIDFHRETLGLDFSLFYVDFVLPKTDTTKPVLKK